jgi:threonylcarbamoyladenosine tRNA methylthiotransferase MtaB
VPTLAIKTLGCKLNQYESEQIREQLEGVGYRTVGCDDGADVFVINSCTVTGKTDRDARRLARRAKRLNPQSFVVMTGCYAQRSADDLAGLPEIDLVVGHEGKQQLAALVARHGTVTAEHRGERPSPARIIDEFSGHTRCFVKAQEGCDASCTYCVIPQARGPSRSVPPADVVAQAQRLGRNGHPELVLVGTHLGKYGHDLGQGLGLSDLVRSLCGLPEVQRVRLSSIEPCEVTMPLLAMVAAGGQALSQGHPPGFGKVCRHLHIPLQSGCDSVLERMNRPYSASFYSGLVTRAARQQPLTCIGTDVIVGFPGETDAEFETTVALVEQLPLAYVHVFTYSPRPGTPAADMPYQVKPETKHQRSEVLRRLSVRKRQAFAQTMLGSQLEVVLQQRVGPGKLRGVTDNYLEFTVGGPAEPPRHLVLCEVTGARDGQLLGDLTEHLASICPSRPRPQVASPAGDQ